MIQAMFITEHERWKLELEPKPRVTRRARRPRAYVPPKARREPWNVEPATKLKKITSCVGCPNRSKCAERGTICKALEQQFKLDEHGCGDPHQTWGHAEDIERNARTLTGSGIRQKW